MDDKDKQNSEPVACRVCGSSHPSVKARLDEWTERKRANLSKGITDKYLQNINNMRLCDFCASVGQHCAGRSNVPLPDISTAELSMMLHTLAERLEGGSDKPELEQEPVWVEVIIRIPEDGAYKEKRFLARKEGFEFKGGDPSQHGKSLLVISGVFLNRDSLFSNQPPHPPTDRG